MHISPHARSSDVLQSTLLEYFAHTAQWDMNPDSTTLVLKKGHILKAVHDTFQNQLSLMPQGNVPHSKKLLAAVLMQGLREGSLIYTVEMNSHSFRVYGTKKAKDQLEHASPSEQAELGNASFTELKEEDLEELDTLLKSTLAKDSAPSPQGQAMIETTSSSNKEEPLSIRLPSRKKNRSEGLFLEAAADSKQSELKKTIATNIAEDTKAQENRAAQEKKKKIEEKEVQRQEERLAIQRQEHKKKQSSSLPNS